MDSSRYQEPEESGVAKRSSILCADMSTASCGNEPKATSGLWKETVCVYCASSASAHEEYYDAARRLGSALAREAVRIVYGGGSIGSMGHLADAALTAGGTVVGILPQFMAAREWGHTGLSELRIVEDMHTRKREMISGSTAAVALPGGCGTLDELFEAITWKRLGLFTGPIILVNTRDFFAPCIELLERCVGDRFLDVEAPGLWKVVAEPEDVVPALRRLD